SLQFYCPQVFIVTPCVGPRANLVEELNAALDRIAAQELQVETEELLFREVPEEEVRKSSTPVKATSRRVEETFKKIEQLQTQMVSLKNTVVQLRDEKQTLREANRVLAREREHLLERLQLLQQSKEAQEAQASEQSDRLRAELQSSERKAKDALQAAVQARRKLLKLRQELGVLRAERDFQCKVNNKIRSRTPRADASSRAGRMDSPAKDDWEDMSADRQTRVYFCSESEAFSDSLESRYSVPNQKASRKTKCPPSAPSPKGRGELQIWASSGLCSCQASLRSWLNACVFSSGALPYIGVTVEPSTAPPGCRYMLIRPTDRTGEESRSRSTLLQGVCQQKRKKHIASQSRAVIRQRLLSLQQQVSVLQREKLQLQAEQRHRENQAQEQLHSLLQQLQANKQLSQRQACELAALVQQKSSLQTELDQWRRARQQTSSETEELQNHIKELTQRLKQSASSEMSKHTAANKSLKLQLDERDQKLKELHDRIPVLERDVAMKRQLVEDLRSRLKICQDSEKNHRGVTEDLEKKIRSLCDESTNRKALLDSLKRRLTVATDEKKQLETSCGKLKEELQKKEQRVSLLQAQLGQQEQALAELERTASTQMHALAEQSTQALERLQRKHTATEAQLQQFHTFIQALASELARDVQETKACLRRRKKSDRMPRCSLVKAASILHMSETDLEDILDTDEGEEALEGRGPASDWTQRVQSIIHQQFFFSFNMLILCWPPPLRASSTGRVAFPLASDQACLLADPLCWPADGRHAGEDEGGQSADRGAGCGFRWCQQKALTGGERERERER
ncbi:hypothetical protein DNTS_026563, partial [Danionella cerebrum]